MESTEERSLKVDDRMLTNFGSCDFVGLLVLGPPAIGDDGVEDELGDVVDDHR